MNIYYLQVQEQVNAQNRTFTRCRTCSRSRTTRPRMPSATFTDERHEAVSAERTTRSYACPGERHGNRQHRKEGPARPASAARGGRPAAFRRGDAVLSRSSKAAPAAQAGAVEAPRSALDRLRAGEVDVNGYVDLKVARGHGAPHGAPSGRARAAASRAARPAGERPGLVDLVRAATGAVPRPPTDD